MRIGYKLIAEAYSPQDIVAQAVQAEEVGFDFVEVSDHFHPWLYETPHSGFAWSMLAAIAAKTERIELATGVTCPFIRYHPAIIAQAASTTSLLSDGRFTSRCRLRRAAQRARRRRRLAVGLGPTRDAPRGAGDHPAPVVSFEAATAFITEDHVRESFGCGPDVERHLEVAQDFVDAGFDQLTLVNAGPDPEGFFEFFATELSDRIRAH